MLTTFALDNYVYQSLRAGASGFMVKDAPPEEIAAAVRIVANGEALLAPSVTRTVIEEFARHPSPPDQPPYAVTLLTPRERNVLDLLIAGLSNPEICDRLYISDATAKTHVARILQKLNVRDRVQVMIYAYESGLIMPGPQRGSQVPLKLRHEAAQRRTLPERHPHRIGFLSRHSVPATVPGDMRSHRVERGSTLQPGAPAAPRDHRNDRIRASRRAAIRRQWQTRRASPRPAYIPTSLERG